MAGFVAGNADSGGRGVAVNIVREPNNIGLGVKMVCKIAADPLDTNIIYTIVFEYLLCSLRTGKSSAAIYLGIALKCAVYIGACPNGQNDKGHHHN